MGARFEDTLLANLREKDELIVVLKRALREKSKRQSELEHIVSLLGSTSPDQILIGNVAAKLHAQIQGGTEPPDSKRPDRSSHPDILILAETSGLYPDNWLKPKSSLALNDSCGGSELVFTFYLPEFPGWASKILKLRPNFSDAVDIEIGRGHAVTHMCAIPKELNFTPRLNLDIIEEPRNESDARELGVLLVSISSGGHAVA